MKRESYYNKACHWLFVFVCHIFMYFKFFFQFNIYANHLKILDNFIYLKNKVEEEISFEERKTEVALGRG